MEDLLSRAREADRDELRAWRALSAWARAYAGRTVHILGNRIIATDDGAVPEKVLTTRADDPVSLARAMGLPGFLPGFVGKE